VFDKEMENKRWRKHKEADTTWTAVFEDGTTESAAVSTTKADVAKCAAAAKIKSYEGAILFSPSGEHRFSS